MNQEIKDRLKCATLRIEGEKFKAKRRNLNRKWLRTQRKRFGFIVLARHLRCPLCLKSSLYLFRDLRMYKCKNCGTEVKYRTAEAGLVKWEKLK